MTNRAHFTFNDVKSAREIRKARNSKKAPVYSQRLLKNGKWGKPRQELVFGGEAPQDVIDRLNKLNPNNTYRLAQ